MIEQAMSSAISLKQVEKKFPPNIQALDAIDLEVADGEFVVVVGPSGCGKTTLLRLIAGLEEPTRGSILLFGSDASVLSPGQRDLGMVFQNHALFPHLSVFENLAYGLRARRVSKAEISSRIDSVARKLNVFDLLKRKPSQLSGGQRQRVALGRLLARDPKIRLFDEPLGSLDPQFRNGMRGELARLHLENQRTTLYVTHDQTEAMTLGQRICVLKEGKLVQQGSPEEIYERPAHRFVAEFFGSPGAHCFEGMMERGDPEGLCFSSGSIRLSLPAKDGLIGSVTLALRPENWFIEPPEKAALGAQVRRVENLGDHRLIEVCAEGRPIVVKTYFSGIRPNETIGLSPLWEEAHWFDSITGERIEPIRIPPIR